MNIFVSTTAVINGHTIYIAVKELPNVVTRLEVTHGESGQFVSDVEADELCRQILNEQELEENEWVQLVEPFAFVYDILRRVAEGE